MEINPANELMDPQALKIDLKQRKLNRLHWLNSMRWFAVGGVVLSIGAGTLLYAIKLPLFLISLAVETLAISNVFYIILCNRISPEKTPMRHINRIIFAEITTDFIILAIILHMSGGPYNLFAFVFVFHIIIASLLVARKFYVYLVAATGWFFMAAIALLEYFHILPSYGLSPLVPISAPLAPLYILYYLAALGTTLFGMAYIGLTLSMMMRRREGYITELKDNLSLWNRRVMEANEKLIEVDQQKTQFMRMSGHELKSPLSGMLSILRTVSEGYVEDKQKIIEMVNLALHRGEEAFSMANELLDLAREKGKDLAPKEFSLEAEAIVEIDRLRPAASDASIELEIDIPEPGLKTFADAESYRLIVRNLVSNAIKYSNKYGRVRISIAPDNGHALLKVEDHGIGIPEEHLAKLFEEFSRAQNALKHTAGTGLGMSIVRRAVENTGGTLGISSREGEGSTFMVRIPLKPSPAQ